MLYSRFAPVGDETTMVPVGVVQVGCTVTDAVGVAGVPGAALTVSGVAEDIHPVAVLRTVTL